MSILVKELGKHVDTPQPPAFYSRPAKAAFDRGVMARCWRGADAQCRYTRRYMIRAWQEGFDAAAKAIEAAK